MAAQPVIRVLSQVLSSAGVTAAYGRPFGDLHVTEIDDPRVAVLLMSAHHAVHGTAAVAHVGNGDIVIGGSSSACIGDLLNSGDVMGSDTRPQKVVDDPAEIFELGPLIREAIRGTGMWLRLNLDPSSTVRGGSIATDAVDDWQQPDPALLKLLSKADRVVMLAGPRIVSEGAVGDLRAMAAGRELGVLNTWGAKGVFHWQSRHHLATVGLQERDFELGGLPEADMIVVVGLNEMEAPARLWVRYPHVIVPPQQLGPLAERIGQTSALPETPRLRGLLSTVTQAGWATTKAPLKPSLVTRHYAQVLCREGVVAADSGISGYWVARTFATTQLRSALVPSGPIRGWAAACVLVAKLLDPLRRGLAVIDGPVDELTLAVHAEAERRGVRFGVEVWQRDGHSLDPEAHLARLTDLAEDSAQIVTLATDESQLDDMVEVAGPVRAWTSDDELS
jgi:hypothetical protein